MKCNDHESSAGNPPVRNTFPSHDRTLWQASPRGDPAAEKLRPEAGLPQVSPLKQRQSERGRSFGAKQQMKWSRRLFVLLLSACWWVLLSASASADFEPHENILLTAASFIEGEARQTHDARFEIRVTPGRLDSRLRLRPCEAGLEGFAAPGGRRAGNTTVGVRCLGPVTWTLYVPVQIEVHGEVVVLAHAQPRGTVLTASQVRLEAHDVGTLSAGYLIDLDEARGMVLRRALQSGTVLTPQMVEPPRLVQRGQRVQLLAENESVAVRVEGEALADGARGDRVRVRNLSSQRIVDGVVLSHGVVGVSM